MSTDLTITAVFSSRTIVPYFTDTFSLVALIVTTFICTFSLIVISIVGFAVSKSLHSPSSIFILNLCVADLIFNVRLPSSLIAFACFIDSLGGIFWWLVERVMCMEWATKYYRGRWNICSSYSNRY